MLQPFRTFFADPSRQAAGWTVVGIVGVLLAVTGVYFLLDDNTARSSFAPFVDDDTPTATSTGTIAPTATATATVRPGLTATAIARSAGQTQTAVARTPSPTSTPTAHPTQPSSFDPPAPTATPTEEPTATPSPTPTTTNLVYCDTTGGGGTPPAAIFGTVTVDGAAAPAGTIVTIAFGGIPSLSAPVTVEGDAAGYRFLYGAGGGGCSNYQGAPIQVIVNGQSFTAPTLVGGAEAVRFDIFVDAPETPEPEPEPEATEAPEPTE